MTQVDFKLSLDFESGRFKLLPILLDPSNCWVLFPNSPNVYRKATWVIFNPRNHFFSLILNLPLDSSPCFNVENNEFHKKTFSNLVFGDDFTYTGTT